MSDISCTVVVFFFQAEDDIRDATVTGVQTCALPICEPDRRGEGEEAVGRVLGGHVHARRVRERARPRDLEVRGPRLDRAKARREGGVPAPGPNGVREGGGPRRGGGGGHARRPAPRPTKTFSRAGPGGGPFRIIPQRLIRALLSEPPDRRGRP